MRLAADYYTIVHVCKQIAGIVRRTKQESERTRRQLLTAARRVFARHGVTRTTLEHIAREAGVTRGAIYWHFANKRELFRAMRDQVSLPLVDRTELLGIDGPDPLLAVARFLGNLIESIEKDPQTRRTFEIMALKCEYVDEFKQELRRNALQCRDLSAKLADAYARARRAGTMRDDIAPQLAALDTCVFITGLLRLWLIDAEGELLRPHVDALIAAHVAKLRRPAPTATRVRHAA